MNQLFRIETSHLIYIAVSYMACNTNLEWVKPLNASVALIYQAKYILYQVKRAFTLSQIRISSFGSYLEA